MESRLDELERRHDTLTRRVDDIFTQSSNNTAELHSLTPKLDALRDDIRDLKRMGETTVPRMELDYRVSSINQRMTSLEENVTGLRVEIKDTRSSLSESIHHNTLVTWGNLLALAIGLILMLGSYFINSSVHRTSEEPIEVPHIHGAFH